MKGDKYTFKEIEKTYKTEDAPIYRFLSGPYLNQILDPGDWLMEELRTDYEAASFRDQACFHRWLAEKYPDDLKVNRSLARLWDDWIDSFELIQITK